MKTTDPPNVHEVTASSAGVSWRKKTPTYASRAGVAVHPLGVCSVPESSATKAYRMSPATHDPREIVSPKTASCSSTVAAIRLLLHALPRGLEDAPDLLADQRPQLVLADPHAIAASRSRRPLRADLAALTAWSRRSLRYLRSGRPRLADARARLRIRLRFGFGFGCRQTARP